MRTHNLSDRNCFQMVHQYTLDTVINLYSSVLVHTRDTFVIKGEEYVMSDVKREDITPTYKEIYSNSHWFYIVKFKKVAPVVKLANHPYHD